jgi:O-antigen/teichoic acid export membrane protein
VANQERPDAPPAAEAREGRFDWGFLRSSALVTVGLTAARVLGFAFSFLLARALSAEAFGAVQYTITLATLVAIGTIPFAEQVLPWFISRHRADPAQLRAALSTGLLLLGGVYGVTLLVAAPALALAGRLELPVLVIFTGLTLFNLYAGLGRGFMAPGRLLAVYLGSNLLQLVATLIALWALGDGAATAVLLIYGLSYLPLIALLELARPLPLAVGRSGVRRETAGELLRFAAPVWASHTLYTLSFALDVLLLERFWGEATVGVYALTKTIVLGFSFVPQGITMLLMPRVASAPASDHRRLLAVALGATMAVNAAALAVFLLVYEPFVAGLVGEVYFIGLRFGTVMALSAIAYGVHAILTSYLLGRNRPGLETLSRAAMAAVMLLAGLALVPRLGAEGAAWANLLTAAAGILAYGAALLPRRRAGRP